MWNLSAPDVVAPMDSHDQRLARVRRVMERERRDRAVQAAPDFRHFSRRTRVGPSMWWERFLREVRRMRWSVFNVPLAAAGDDDCAVLGLTWSLTACIFQLWKRCTLGGALRDTKRSWGVSSREDFAEWMHRQGFVRPRWRAHLSKNSERQAALESFYVHLITQACSSEQTAAAPEVRPRATADSAPAVGETQWNCLDDIKLQEVFQMRFRVLQSCLFT